MTDLGFKEIEHKFLVDRQFDLAGFRLALAALSPLGHSTFRVRDRYFVTAAGRASGFVIRHRQDEVLHQLTFKTVAEDAEVRDEVNLALRLGDQDAQVEAFVAGQSLLWQGECWKDLEVWNFPECEVVHYTASTQEVVVHCVEFEALHKPSLAEALAVVARFETATGFSSAARTRLSLLELLWPRVLVEMGWRGNLGGA